MSRCAEYPAKNLSNFALRRRNMLKRDICRAERGVINGGDNDSLRGIHFDRLKSFQQYPHQPHKKLDISLGSNTALTARNFFRAQ